MTQMLMAEDKPIRRLLVEYLANNPSRPATVALAQRALFDVAFEIREQALQALADRPRDDFRAVLLDGLRYPWAPVADHAAEALVALKDADAVPRLEALFREPDPQAPALNYERGSVAVRELVRINHLSNCALCHPFSTLTNDPVRGLVPSPSQPLTPQVGSYDGPGGPFIRADVTYLRQDFSLPQPVAHPGNWPAHQRYDYFVRLRDLSSEELSALKRDTTKKPGRPSPQREALLFALRELREEELSQ